MKLHCRNRLVVANTEWLPWLLTLVLEAVEANICIVSETTCFFVASSTSLILKQGKEEETRRKLPPGFWWF